MAEYIESICRRCFHSYVCERFNEHRDDHNERCHFFNDHFVSAADVVEVVHAKWKPKYNKEDGYWHNVCSACKTESVFEYEYEPDYDEGLDGEWHYIGQMECGIREHLTNYCPNCGAKMHKEEPNGTN